MRRTIITSLRSVRTQTANLPIEDMSVQDILLLDEIAAQLADIVRTAKAVHVGETGLNADGQTVRIDWVAKDDRSIVWTTAQRQAMLDAGNYKVVHKEYGKFTVLKKGSE